ncbi:hypothetical protein [Sinorhizobium medicae]|uniref:hypothetical protein n=1 Tax=Sinorhizobium medicae TaxID=110321 RepID=UPI0010727C90|nr:hypothetical protein [Sinorhizobium medicae]
MGRAWEKAKKEVANFEKDIRVWVETGKCGGDICDAFAAAVDFVEATIEDIGPTLEHALERLAEGKPLDAIWHLTTDPLKNSSKNAAAAAQRSRVLAATGQVAASVYGGPAGAAGYTAWLTYETTGNLGDAIRAGVISGASSAAIQSINAIDLNGAEGIVARTVMTGAVSGAAVALAGGDEDAIRAAVGAGMTAALVREGYRQLTKLDLDRNRLRSSTGDAYCLNKIPLPADFSDPTSCVGPKEAYTFEADGQTVQLESDGTAKIEFMKLDPNRPHVGTWADGTEGRFNLKAENSAFMTGVSRLPGWNAMAVGHDQLAINLELDIISSAATIPPAVVLTYVGAGMGIHDAIRETYVARAEMLNQESSGSGTGKATGPAVDKLAQEPGSTSMQKEVLHLFCEPPAEATSPRDRRTDLLVEVQIGKSRVDGSYQRICEIRQLTGGTWYELGHAHYDLNYCHRAAERIAVSRQRKGYSCYGSTGIRSDNMASTSSASP